ncbi:MAG: hypothetical protein JWM28_2956 [Chitinophagaceae bacterium]|nr:hypothetical protein [Chitinophagaceae bacterium]
MRHTLTIIATIFLITASFGQTVKRQNNETAEMFATRFNPDSTEIAHTVIETALLDPTEKIIIAFYRKTIYETRQMDTYVDHSDYEVLIGTLFIPTGDNNYEKKLLDTIRPDGGDPEIIAVFFGNVDKDRNKELMILCKYDQQHYDYGGAFYSTFIYDYSGNQVQYKKKLSEKFSGCECSFRDGRRTKAKYKTAKEVKAALVKMGFKQ